MVTMQLPAARTTLTVIVAWAVPLPPESETLAVSEWDVPAAEPARTTPGNETLPPEATVVGATGLPSTVSVTDEPPETFVVERVAVTWIVPAAALAPVLSLWWRISPEVGNENAIVGVLLADLPPQPVVEVPDRASPTARAAILECFSLMSFISSTPVVSKLLPAARPSMGLARLRFQL
jgi:hypothetical protein